MWPAFGCNGFFYVLLLRATDLSYHLDSDDYAASRLMQNALFQGAVGPLTNISNLRMTAFEGDCRKSDHLLIDLHFPCHDFL